MIKLYVDLDGVLADFLSHLNRAHGSNVRPTQFDLNPLEFGVSTLEEVFSVCDTEFWETIPLLPWADRMINTAFHLDPSFKIITTPAQTCGCVEGKFRWLSKYLPSLEISRVMFSRDKVSDVGVSSSWEVLIDDRESTIREWRDAGGTGLLFPAYHNSSMGSEDSRAEKVEEFFEALRELYLLALEEHLDTKEYFKIPGALALEDMSWANTEPS